MALGKLTFPLKEQRLVFVRVSFLVRYLNALECVIFLEKVPQRKTRCAFFPRKGGCVVLAHLRSWWSGVRNVGSTHCVILGKSCFLSRPQVPYLQNEVLPDDSFPWRCLFILWVYGCVHGRV